MSIGIELTYLHVSVAVRYWEDTWVNDVEDTDGTLIPFRNGDLWEPIIYIPSGRIINWPLGTTAIIHYKVCDAGQYWLGDETNKLYKYRGYYVPDHFLCHGDNGYGDYIILKVDKDGYIIDYQPPNFDKNDWKKV